MSNNARISAPIFRTPTTRRRLLKRSVGSAAGAAAALTFAKGIGAQVATPSASPAASPVSSVPNGIQADGTWVFTDDRGVTVTLPKQPERIFADLSAAAPLWDFGIRPLAVSGWTTTTDIAWGNVDRATEDITEGTESGVPDAEKLIGLNPDIYVNITWSKGDPLDVWGFPDAETIARFEQIAPIVCIAATGRADENMMRFAELAGLLGADLTTPELVSAQETYDTSLEAFGAAVEEKADITSLFAYVSVGEATWYAASPRDWADLAWYQALGMSIVEPEAEPGAYWQELSREQAGLYPSDIFFNSTRDGTLTIEELAADPTFGALPVIKSGQIGAWNQDFIMSYQGLTAALDNMTATILESEKLT